MDVMEISAVWGLLAVAGMGIAALPWSERELSESSSAFTAAPRLVLAWCGSTVRGLVRPSRVLA